MEPVEAASYAIHSVFAGLLTGSVLFVVLGVLPLARDGELNAAPLESIAGTLTTLSRVSALVLVVTGGYMGVVQHSVDSLLETVGGWLVLSMVVLWVGLMATIEVGTSRVTDGTERDKVRAPARDARPVFLVAAVLATLLLVVAGLLSASNLGFL